MLSERYEDVLSAHFHFQHKKSKKELSTIRNIIWNHNPILRINLSVIYTILLLRNEKVNCEECEIWKKSVRWIFLYVFVYIFHNFVWRLSKSFHLFYLYKKKSNLIPNYRECVFTTKYTHRIQNRNPKSYNTILYMFWELLEIDGWLVYKI